MKDILKFLKSIFNIFYSSPHNTTHCQLIVPLTLKQRQMVTRLIEKSGVKDLNELFTYTFSTFELQVDHELNGGSIDLVEPNGVNKEKLNLLRRINKIDDDWKEE